MYKISKLYFLQGFESLLLIEGRWQAYRDSQVGFRSQNVPSFRGWWKSVNTDARELRTPDSVEISHEWV